MQAEVGVPEQAAAAAGTLRHEAATAKLGIVNCTGQLQLFRRTNHLSPLSLEGSRQCLLHAPPMFMLHRCAIHSAIVLMLVITCEWLLREAPDNAPDTPDRCCLQPPSVLASACKRLDFNIQQYCQTGQLRHLG